jgi:predicted phosphodiesterase
MKIISYSDLHLEFGSKPKPPADSDADLMILAGDIITFRDFALLRRFLKDWKKPVLYVAGNHEYYTLQPMQEGNAEFKAWLGVAFPNVTFLQDEEVTIDGVHFFGGTMWTDFSNANRNAMDTAQMHMNDFRMIMDNDYKPLKPVDTVTFHNSFVSKLVKWFEKDLSGPRAVVTHHAPVLNPHTQYGNSSLSPAFNSLDMPFIIEKYQPSLWVYGHTHECDDQTVGSTRIISNQLGYPQNSGKFECKNFDATGLPVEV